MHRQSGQKCLPKPGSLTSLPLPTPAPAALQGVLTAQELRLLVASYHRPSFALAVLSELAAEAPVNEVQRVRLDENLTYFQQCVGECERLLRTPIPLSYTRHTSRFLLLWLPCRTHHFGCTPR